MKSLSRLVIAALSATGTLLLVSAVHAAGGGSMPSGPMPEARAQSPEEKARGNYNDGVRLIHKADDADAAASKATEPAKRQKSVDRAAEFYRKALGKFSDAVSQGPGMYQAWNYLGYANRHLGNYAEALSAYDQALTLKPDYSEAIEYRGHAYLGLDRLDDAKAAYLALFSADRTLANQLLAGMQAYVAAKRSAAAAGDASALEAFAKWVDERAGIAAKTAALTRAGGGSGWR